MPLKFLVCCLLVAQASATNTDLCGGGTWNGNAIVQMLCGYVAQENCVGLQTQWSSSDGCRINFDRRTGSTATDGSSLAETCASLGGSLKPGSTLKTCDAEATDKGINTFTATDYQSCAGNAANGWPYHHFTRTIGYEQGCCGFTSAAIDACTKFTETSGFQICLDRSKWKPLAPYQSNCMNISATDCTGTTDNVLFEYSGSTCTGTVTAYGGDPMAACVKKGGVVTSLDQGGYADCAGVASALYGKETDVTNCGYNADLVEKLAARCCEGSTVSCCSNLGICNGTETTTSTTVTTTLAGSNGTTGSTTTTGNSTAASSTTGSTTGSALVAAANPAGPSLAFILMTAAVLARMSM